MATVQEAVGKEMLLTIVEDEASQQDDGEPSKKKRKGAYITPIESKILLRKTRAKVSPILPTSSLHSFLPFTPNPLLVRSLAWAVLMPL